MISCYHQRQMGQLLFSSKPAPHPQFPSSKLSILRLLLFKLASFTYIYMYIYIFAFVVDSSLIARRLVCPPHFGQHWNFQFQSSSRESLFVLIWNDGNLFNIEVVAVLGKEWSRATIEKCTPHRYIRGGIGSVFCQLVFYLFGWKSLIMEGDMKSIRFRGLQFWVYLYQNAF